MTQTYQSGFETTLAVRLNASDTTATLATVPTVTKGRMYLDNGEQKEWLSFTGVSGSTITGLTRGLSQTEDPATAGTGLTWIAGTKIKLVAMHDQMADKLEGDQALFSAKVYATTAARDSALGADGAATKAYTNIYIEGGVGGGLFYDYNLSTNQRESRDTGTTTPNASATEAGKVEQSTAAQTTAGTATGETGAPLFATPADIAKVIQSGTRISFSSATGSDTYTATMTPALTAYTTNMVVVGKFTTANTGACSVNIDSLGAKSIKTVDGNDPQDGVIRANSVHVLVYDGTNFVLMTPDFAAADRKGVAEMASDAEATTGTDETRYVNPKQAKDNYANLINVVTGTRTSGSGTGSQSIAHGLSRTPLMVLSYYSEALGSIGFGFYGDSAHRGGRIQDSGQYVSTSLLINTSGAYDAAVTGLDGTNLTVNRTGGTDTTTYTLVFLA